MPRSFEGSFTQQEPLSARSIAAANAVMQHGRLHRYNTAEGEQSETALLERDFAEFVGSKYCLAVASGGYAIATALRALGVGPGDIVLTNAFTLAPVPGAIAAAGASPVFVEIDENLTIYLADLQRKISENGARYLLLSHMRGHICDMDRLMEICDAADVKVVEDCAHTMGASWGGVASGRHGIAACYSTQTYKHINSGEGGLLVSDDPDVMARAILLSGSYMLYGRHLAGPDEKYFASARYETPNISGRMDNLRAAILRPQLDDLAKNVERWNERYDTVERGLRGCAGLTPIQRGEQEQIVGSSFQFRLAGWDDAKIARVVENCAARGVELKWFGNPEPVGFTSTHQSWRYVRPQDLPQTDEILGGVLDMRIPLTFSLADCELVASIIHAEVSLQFQAPD